MTLRARLTLSSVGVTTVIVALISAVDLGNHIQRQFEGTLKSADRVKTLASNLVRGTVARERDRPPHEALRDIAAELVELLANDATLLEIAVCDPNHEILADSDPRRLGVVYPGYPDFTPVVRDTGWIGKLRILSATTRYYQLEQPLGAQGQILYYVRVVVAPGFIRADIAPDMRKSATVAVASVAGAFIVTLVFSTIAFRPLGRLGHMLDLLTRGEYEFQETLPATRDRGDEFGVMASKVSLLGEQLRGARYDYSDLRGNFERLLDDLEDAVLIFGRDQRLVIASGAVERFLGQARAGLTGQPMSDILPPATPIGLLVAQAAETGRPVHNRRVPLTPAGGAPGSVAVVLLTVDMMESPSAGANRGQASAIAIRLRDPEATRQIGRQLQTADRLSAISRITGGVAHEVKNPLNAMLMHVDLARIKLAKGDTDLLPQMEIIAREILRLDRVVKTFLDFTRPVELKLTEIPVDEMLDEIVELARPQALSSGIQIDLERHAEGVTIRGDQDLLKQAILNLAVNAIEAMSGGGQLCFESSVAKDEVRIRISDTGPGIPPELRDKIFRLYFTTKKEGSGIGLAMTFRIAQLHDGTIDFTSEPGQGATFVMRLPLA